MIPTKDRDWDTGIPSRATPRKVTRAEFSEWQANERKHPSLGWALIQWYFETGVYVLVDDDGNRLPLSSSIEMP